MQICFATNNEHKIKEVNALLGDGFNVVGLSDVGCFEDLAETQPTLEGNSNQKANYVYQNYGVDVFADDTGLEVEVLNGAPGVHSARYAGEHRNNDDNISLLLKQMDSEKNRKAQFRTVITLYLNDAKTQFEGIVKGKLLHQRTGEGGFGYDPIFVPDGFEKSFAQMTLEEKNKISHRGKALSKLISFCKTKSVK